MLYDMYNTISLYYRVVYNLRAPSVAELYAREIDCIATLLLADIDAITHYDGIATLNDIEQLRTVLNYRIKAFAARKGKEYYNHTQCQGESRRLRG